jgi:subtilisin family serine protease
VITVAATGRAGQKASYSNYGALIEISAPGGADGEGVLSTLNTSAFGPDPLNNTYAYYGGTSMAAPHVTGIVSLMLSRNPSLTPAQVMSHSADHCAAVSHGNASGLHRRAVRRRHRRRRSGSIGSGRTRWARRRPRPRSRARSIPAQVGASVTLTATVNGTTPTGNVGFTDNGNAMAGCTAFALTGYRQQPDRGVHDLEPRRRHSPHHRQLRGRCRQRRVGERSLWRR